MVSAVGRGRSGVAWHNLQAGSSTREATEAHVLSPLSVPHAFAHGQLSLPGEEATLDRKRADELAPTRR